MKKTDGNELVRVTLSDVTQLLQTNFTDLTQVQITHFRNMYEFLPENGNGCYFNVKIPPPDEYGVALHITTGLRLKSGDNLIVYPKKSQTGKQGRGHYTSRSIDRDKHWKRNLIMEALIGEGICRKLYYNEKQSQTPLNDFDKDMVYNLYNQKRELSKELVKVSTKLKEVDQPKSKTHYQQRIREINLQMHEINTKLDAI